ncbi:MAG: TonB-dependent receptor; Outer membrane receptor for ferrienterochelin and colicins [uncultured Aureispira sp.]|uniref:TonB-dependent receptor Outer membrane receptor for ferrienterochelin and colicins n=1 Tax=uncultured Aureispira sp. TaxID=1331704 RepID=A0A6S6S797_9BACT|nr:MAG: TonB-dependent receptor; Outer membrane receptor for ferrienterochelin and colicins [uncultured Aureispira sp.]
MKFIVFILAFLFATLSLNAQKSLLKGRIVNSDNEAVIAANVLLLQDSILTNWGATTDIDGTFTLENVPLGTYTLQTSYIGFANYQTILKIEGKTLDLGIIRLAPASGMIDEIVVTHKGATIFNPTKIAPTVATKYVVDPKALEKITAPTNLIEAISLVSGVQEEVACGVCFTNTIRINGLPGAYTAVLIDGTPMYGNLASIYALNGLPTTMIERIEITKGPSSTIFGSEAVAGAINVLTKNPSKEPLISLDIMGTSHLESFNNLSVAGTLGKFSGMVGLSHAYVGTNHDDNGDGFGDLINLDRVSAFAKLTMKRPKNRRFSLFARYYYEDRRNGVEDFVKGRNYLQLRGNDLIYGESIFTQRWELLGTYDLPTEEYFKLDYSFSGHYQDSYYGSDYYNATQYVGYTNFNWNKYVKGHGITAGVNFRYQYYDDNTLATVDSVAGNVPSHQFIPGLFLQDAWDLSKKVALLYGCRLDYFQAHGFIPAPRFNLKYKPDTWTTFRLNFGTGFRIVNLFTEDHAFITGNRQVEITEQIQPERSYNGSLNFNYVFTMGSSQGTFNLDGFYTYFTNAIFPDYSQPNKIVYKNLNGYAQTRGFSANYSQQFTFPLALSLSYNMQWADQTDIDEQGNKTTGTLEYTPLYSGSLVVNYTHKPWHLNLAYTATLTGPMQLPEVFDLDGNGNPLPSARPTTSKPFSMHNVQITKDFPKLNLSLYIGAQNLLDYRQEISPLVGYNDPNAPAGFSEHFDTAYAYSTIHGREFYFGLRWKWSPVK